ETIPLGIAIDQQDRLYFSGIQGDLESDDVTVTLNTYSPDNGLTRLWSRPTVPIFEGGQVPFEIDFFPLFDVEVNAEGELFVSSVDTRTITKHLSDGTVISEWSGFEFPEGLALAPDGLV